MRLRTLSGRKGFVTSSVFSLSAVDDIASSSSGRLWSVYLRLRRAAHSEGVAGISGPFTYQAEHSREFATWSEEHVAFESSGLSCSLLWTVSVISSFTICLGRPFPRHHHRKRFCHPYPNHHEKENDGFHITCEEWEELSGLDSPTLLCQRPEQQRQQHQTCEQRAPTCTTHPRSDGSFFPLAKRFGEGRSAPPPRAHSAPRTATGIPSSSFLFFRTRCPH